MATAAAPDMVWVGFMDVVPVIGTVKEGVEWILAVYENNKEMVKEKEQQIIGSLQPQMKSEMEKLQKGLKNTKLNETPEARQEEGSEETATKKAGLQVTEIKQSEILEYLKRCSSSQENMRQKEKKEKSTTIKEIKMIVQKNIQDLTPDGRLARELMIEVLHTKTGAHVFNKGILSFHFRVLRWFKNQYGIESNPQYRDVPLTASDNDKLIKDIQSEFETKDMKHNFTNIEFYIDANAVLYALYSQELGDAFYDVLKCIYLSKVSREMGEKIMRIIDLMNKHEIYVDHLAKVQWIKKEKENEECYKNVKDKVLKMYNEHGGYDWCINILEQFWLWFTTPTAAHA